MYWNDHPIKRITKTVAVARTKNLHKLSLNGYIIIIIIIGAQSLLLLLLSTVSFLCMFEVRISSCEEKTNRREQLNWRDKRRREEKKANDVNDFCSCLSWFLYRKFQFVCDSFFSLHSVVLVSARGFCCHCFYCCCRWWWCSCCLLLS